MRSFHGITILGVRLAVIALAVYWIILFLGTHWPAGVPVDTRVNDKTKHFVGYAALALFYGHAWLPHWLPRRTLVRRWSLAAGILAGFAAIDEATQAWVPGRTPDPMDWVADVLGIATGLALHAAIGRWRRR